MRGVSPAKFVQHFESLPDPRQDRNRRHLLVDIIAIAVCGVLVGCDGPTAIRLWAQHHEGWLREFLTLPNGLPSKDCLRRVLSLVNPEAFTRCFAEWVAANLSTDAAGRLIAIDGRRCVAAMTARRLWERYMW